MLSTLLRPAKPRIQVGGRVPISFDGAGPHDRQSFANDAANPPLALSLPAFVNAFGSVPRGQRSLFGDAGLAIVLAVVGGNRGDVEIMFGVRFEKTGCLNLPFDPKCGSFPLCIAMPVNDSRGGVSLFPFV